MGAVCAVRLLLLKLRQVADYDRKERTMDELKPSGTSEEQVTFSHEEFTRNPDAVMHAAEHGRVVVTDSSGQPSLAISRQLDEISIG